MRFPTAVLPLLLMLAGCYAPQIQYPYTPMVTERRTTLQRELLALLPLAQRNDPAAAEEARWLADTAYKAAAAIARINNSHFPGWAGNALINSRLQDRGLCWHYQHDMYRELRRRPLRFFRIGCCVRDRATGSEHNCIYLCPAGNAWPHVVILDAWRYHGKLKVMKEEDFADDAWEDAPASCRFLSAVYPERHSYPMEH